MATTVVKIIGDASNATQAVDNLDVSLNAADNSTKDLNKSLVDTKKSSDQFETSLKSQEARIKTLDGAINLVGGSLELLTGGLLASGLLTEEQAESFEKLTIAAIGVADGAKRVFDGYRTISEARKLYLELTEQSTVAEAKNTAALSTNAGAAGAITVAQNAAATSILTEKTATDNNTISKGVNTAAVIANTATVAKQTPVLFTNAAGTEAIDLAQKKATISATALGLAQKALPWVAIATAVATVIGLIISYTKSQDDASDSTSKFNSEAAKEARAIKLAKAELSSFTGVQISYADALDATFTIEENNIRVLRARGASLETIYKAEKQLLELRIKAAQAQIEADQVALNNLRQATEILKQQQEALGNKGTLVSIQATLDALDAQQTKLNNSKKALANLQTDLKVLNIEFQNDVKARGETAAKGVEDAFQAEQDYYDKVNNLMMDEGSKRILAVAKQYDDLIEQAAQYGYDTTALEEARQAAIDKVIDDAADERLKKQKEADDKELAERRAFRQQLSDLTVDSALGTLSALSELNSIYDRENEDASRKAFNREKALNIAETIVSTYSAAQKAYTSQLIPGDPTSIVRAQIAAGVAIAGGLARVAVISQQKFEPNGSGSSTAAGGPAVTGGGFVSAPATGNPGSITPPNAGNIGGRIQTNDKPEAVRAYVMSGDVMSATQASTNINRRRTLTQG